MLMCHTILIISYVGLVTPVDAKEHPVYIYIYIIGSSVDPNSCAQFGRPQQLCPWLVLLKLTVYGFYV